MAAHFLHLLLGKPADETRIRALDASFILYAEHEFNASTFAAALRLQLADFYSAITSELALCAVRCMAAQTKKQWRSSNDFRLLMKPKPASWSMLSAKQLVMGRTSRV
jgi:2-methylcitrate synthase